MRAAAEKNKGSPRSDSKGSFQCGHCGKAFKPYHDGDGINTGLCPKCLTLQDTVGLDLSPEQRKHFKTIMRKEVRTCLNCGRKLREENIFGAFCTECCRIEYFNKKK